MEDFGDHLHISHSQISCYQNCSLKYFYRYVEGRKSESINISLPFGSAIHTSLATYYRGLKNGHTEPLDAITDTFKTCLSLDIDSSEAPVHYTKNMPDKDIAIAMGEKMLETYYQNIDLKGYEVIDVELRLSGQLFTSEGQPTDFQLVGIVDLLLRNSAGDLLVVDFKTASKSISQSSIDTDTQLTSYSYLLAANHYVPSTADVETQFQVLLKLKSPRIQAINSTRTRSDRKRLCKIASVVLSGVSNGVFMPVQSWLCSSCEYATACKEW